MSLRPNEPFTWTHPENGEVYHFVAEEVRAFGSIYEITLKDGTRFDAWCYEINAPDSIEITEEQVNPEPSDEPVRHGVLMV